MCTTVDESKIEHEESERNPALILGTASFLNDAGSDMIAPIWPTFLTTQLGISPGQVQIVDGLALMITSLSKLGAGYASDKSGKRKSFITLGYTLSAAARIGFILATLGYQLFQIILWKSMDRLGKMRGPPRDAIVAAHATEKKRGRAFGVLRALDTAGAVIGTIITFLLFAYLGYTGIILLAVIPSLGSVIVVSVLIKEKRGKDVFKGISFRGLDSNLVIFLIASVLFALATFSYSLLILYSASFGYTVEHQTLLYLLFTFVYAATAYPFGRASDRVGRKPILIAAFLFLILTSLWAFSFTMDMLTIIPLFIFFGLMNGALDPVQTSFVADLVEEERRASIIGAFQMVVGIAAFPAGLIIGFLWDSFNPHTAFLYSIILSFAALILLLTIKTKKRNGGPGGN
ncbi:MAG: MFS transporter [Candidatus Thorarchaeota archaeon]|nr:MFS transporter [Candidatus Thorarchaeota archaeon]